MSPRAAAMLLVGLSLWSSFALAQAPDSGVKQRKLTQETGRQTAETKRPVIFLFNWTERRWVVGEKVPLQFISAILFTAEPCPLDFVGSRRMHRAWHFHDVGCWSPTQNDGYDFASSLTGDIENIPGPMEYMVHGDVQADSSVLIIEPGFDSLTFPKLAAQRIGERQAQRLRQMLDAQP